MLDNTGKVQAKKQSERQTDQANSQKDKKNAPDVRGKYEKYILHLTSSASI